MRPFRELAAFVDVRRLALEMAVRVTDLERLPLSEAHGRVLARDATARVDVPSADRAAMDGYAVRSRDASREATLRCVGRVVAGESPSTELRRGECVEIATGAPVPPGADAVIRVERTRRDGDRIRIGEDVTPGDDVTALGSDLRRGARVVEEGSRVGAARISALAAAGVTTVEVLRRPRVLLAPTGDELVPVGEELPAGKVYDSNAAALRALLVECGAEVERTDAVPDTAAALRHTLQRPGFDLVATIGGTSVGRRDLVSDAVAEAGEIGVHGVAVRPGKPLLLGTVGDRPVVGMPGFPTTCMMLGYALLAPMVRRLAGRPTPPTPFPAYLDRQVGSPAGLYQLLPVALDGETAVPTYTFSSRVTSMSDADGWIEIEPERESLAEGASVGVHPFHG